MSSMSCELACWLYASPRPASETCSYGMVSAERYLPELLLFLPAGSSFSFVFKIIVSSRKHWKVLNREEFTKRASDIWKKRQLDLLV